MIARCLSKAFLFFRLLLLFAAAGILFLHAGQAPAQAADEAPQGPVNPHWTGKNCIECHTEESPKGRGAPLKFAGDPVALCARCHKTGLSCTDIHPVGVAPTPDMEPIFPRQWPLQNGKVSCLTCHDVLCQMSENSAAKAANFKFIRGAPYESLTDFCFICHRKEQYKKTNPHTIQFQGDRINEDSCLFCHQSLPDPDLNKNIGEVSFKGELLSYCINCHPEQKQSHPAQGNHMVRLPDAMKDSLSLQLTENSIDFPLDNGTIICSTCHNPHQKGVLHRKEAQPGAGEPAFLRRSRGYELCVSCHTDKRPKETDNKTEEQQAQTETVNINSIHKPIKENKCKKCHVITVTSRDKPDALNLCFREG
ncbi:MAG: cytochrome c3 family protein [Pseudomonadota bacterium]